MARILVWACLWLGLIGCVQQRPPAAVPVTLPATAAPPTPAANPTPDYSVFQAGLVRSEQDAPSRPLLRHATRYHIDLTIEEDLTTLQGVQTLHYTNQENGPQAALYFHLYPNLLGGEISVGDVKVDGGVALAEVMANAGSLRVTLPSPLAVGETAVIEMAFTTRVATPETGSGGNHAILIYADEMLALAHFYPQLAVYDEGNWHTQIDTQVGDIVYAESSFYEVDISAPAALVMATSGIEQSREEANGRQQLQVAAGPVRDFYLIGSPLFEKISTQVGETTINHYGLPKNGARNAEALEIAAAAVEIFNQRIGLYPFTELDIATSPTRALGVEYPGIVVNADRIYTPGDPRLERTTVHEVAHQWFYSTIGNDQLSEPWLDESFTQFGTLLYYEEVYGVDGRAGFQRDLEAWGGLAAEAELPLGLPVAAYEPVEYGSAIYGRGPLFFLTLEEVMGEAAFSRFLRDYYTTFKYDVATAEGLQTTAEANCECDLAPLFQTWIYGD